MTKNVQSRAKAISADQPFGTLFDVYADGYEFIQHSIRPADPVDIKTYRTSISNDQCSQPYSASVFNISAMSFGSLSANAIRALNKGAALGGFYHDTGEGGVSPYHREFGGGDLCAGGCRALELNRFPICDGDWPTSWQLWSERGQSPHA